MTRRPLVLLLVQQTLRSGTRSGVQQVVIRLCKHLPEFADVEFVKWDYRDGQMRYLDDRDLQKLFAGEPLPPSVRVNPNAHRVNYRFSDTLPKRAPIWLLAPEIAYHSQDGTEVMTRICAMCRESEVRTAAVFYDLIPITNIHYRSMIVPHSRYVAQLARHDRIYTISHYSKSELEKLYGRYLGSKTSHLLDLCDRIVAAPLGEADLACPLPPPTPQDPPRTKIVVLGTVEPRKRQLQVLRAFEKIPAVNRAGLELHVVGSMHPDVAIKFNALVASSSQFYYHGYASPAEIDALFAGARFTIFASDDEGFGLPITESVARGVPCLTANFGAMAEVASGGGCFTVNVSDSSELAAAMTRLASDQVLLHRLHDEIRSRRLRTWRDYAQQIISDMQASCVADAANDQKALTVATAADSRHAEKVQVNGMYAIALGPGAPAPKRKAHATGAPIHAAAVDGAPHDCQIPTSETSFSPDTYAHQAVLADTSRQAPIPRPHALVRRRQIADREKLLCTIAEKWPSSRPPRSPLLTIAISTFNRARFVQENVRWLLHILPKFSEDIRLVVVDNASTDDTLDRLAEFAGSPRLAIVSNPVNVGMLGNLRVCSTLMGSRHVWVTGDDDFIIPSGLAEVVDAIREHPEIPFVFTNFGIYHRTHLGPNETAQDLVAERVPLAPKPSPSGLYPVVRIAEEHDNLFTAIYPIVFRSDLLAACFNYPFDGRPFSDLVESVPTTKMILETYGSTESYWCAKMGVVGNASNSWSRHRPRWHGVLIPKMFRLAWEVGVNATKLQQWSATHFELFQEAKRSAMANGVELDIATDELEDSHIVFKRSISLT